MSRFIRGLTFLAVVCSVSVAAAGGPCGHCSHCKRTAAGNETPYGDTGCGPRFCGAKHDECWAPDPCDACARWRGCNGVGQMPEKFPPWQLPPGRGFQSGQDVGYRSAPCGRCNPCGPQFPWLF